MSTTRELVDAMVEAAALGICAAKCGIKEPQGSIRESAIKDHAPEARAALLAALRVLKERTNMTTTARRIVNDLVAALQGDTATGEGE